MDSTPSTFSTILHEHLTRPGTYVLAMVVGTLINLYGHGLVPALHGEKEPASLFVWKLVHEPGVMAASIFIAYLFPFLVGIYASVRAQMNFTCPKCDVSRSSEGSTHA